MMAERVIASSYDSGDSPEGQHVHPHRWVVRAVSATAALIGGLLLIATAFLFSQGADLERLLALGYPGVSIIMFFSSATVFLPAPGFAAMLAAGGTGQFNPFVLGLFAAVGSSVGELTGYLVGLGGRQVLHGYESAFWRRVEYFMRRWGFLTILVMASFPNPLFDAVGILAGSLGYPARRLWVACLIGNLIKYTSLILLGGTAAGVFFRD